MELDDERDQASNRVNLRINPGLYQKMCAMGRELGFDTPTAAAKHFLTLGIQFSLNQFATMNSAKKAQDQATDFYKSILEMIAAGGDPQGGSPAEIIPVQATEIRHGSRAVSKTKEQK